MTGMWSRVPAASGFGAHAILE
jgi:hypothetical protein